MRRAQLASFSVAVALMGGLFALPMYATDTVPAHAPMVQDQPSQPASPAPPAAAPATAEPSAKTEPALGVGTPHQPLTGQTAGMAAGATYVGSETCTTCHDTVQSGLAHTPHGSAAFGKLAPHGCETCHGPGSKHVDNPDDPAFRPRVDKFPASVVNATCRSCHDGRAQFFWDDSTHAKRGLACTTCHSIHNAQSDPQLRRASIAEQCETCHQQVRAETWKNSHHPIREGKITCTDCHNPHGSQAPRMVKADSVNDLCYSCHTEKRGPFLWEHAPVREDCMNCHTPHGSNHTRLNRVAVPYLCQQCHANTRHPGSLYDARSTAGPASELPPGVTLSPSNRLFERACINCHQEIHGSNSPSSPYLAH